MKKIFILWFSLLGSASAFAQTGEPDLSFAEKGWTTFSFLGKGNHVAEEGLKTLVLNDDSYLVLLNADRNVVLTRYHADGTRDNTYGTDGFSVPFEMEPVSATLQSDGKVVVVGSRYKYDPSDDDYFHYFVVMRYNNDGSLDNNFATNGVYDSRVLTEGFATCVAIQADGNIVAGGHSYDANTGMYDFAIVRLSSDGIPDNTFGTNGIVTTDFGYSEEIHAMAIQEDGKIVVAGEEYYLYYTYDYDFALARYYPDGTLDESFGLGGKVVTNLADDGYSATSSDHIYAMVIYPDGRLLVGGSSTLADYYFGLARYNSDGSLDISFGTGGVVRVRYGDFYDYLYALALQSDGKILAGGYTYLASSGTAVLTRLNDDGTTDISFGTNGAVYNNFAGTGGSFNDLVLLSGDHILATGYYYNYDRDDEDYALARYNSDGSPDLSFNTTGSLWDYYPVDADTYLEAMAVQTDGKIVVAGEMYGAAMNYDVILARFNTDGSLDASFGTSGKVETDLGSWENVRNVMIQADGKILVAGYIEKNTYDFFVVRYNANGTLDSRFGSQGAAIIDFGGDDCAYGVVVQSDGKVVVGGYASTPAAGNDFAVARLTSRGALDKTFSSDGKLNVDFGVDDLAYSIALQTDGKIILVGATTDYGNNISNYAVLRINSDGTLDNSFDADGMVNADFGNWEFGFACALQSDGKILVGGSTYSDATEFQEYTIIRFNADGSIDTEFGTNGQVKSALESDYTFVRSLALQADGKILAGAFNETASDAYMIITRFEANGVPDNSFGSGGMIIPGVGASNILADLAWSNYRIFVAGNIMNNLSVVGLVMVYNGTPVPPGLSKLSIEDKTVNETDGTVTLNISLNKVASSDIIVDYSTQDSTAVSKGRYTDYKALKGRVTIAAGSMFAPVTISITQDNIGEPDEYFKVNVDVNSKSVALAEVEDGTGVVTIISSTPPVTMALSNANSTTAPAGLPALSATVYPNPSNAAFTMQIQSAIEGPANIRITDISGKLIENFSGLNANTTIQFGSRYRAGVYYAIISQGSQKTTVKLVRQ